MENQANEVMETVVDSNKGLDIKTLGAFGAGVAVSAVCQLAANLIIKAIKKANSAKTIELPQEEKKPENQEEEN